jgi:ABC-2 type transport system ATP-binding protein
MDEPTVGIDPQSRNHILQSVRQLNEMGCTIIYTSHYMEEVEELCSKAAIMDHGKIIAEGNINALKASIINTNSVWITVDSVLRIDETKLRKINGVKNIELNDNLVKINSASDVNNLDRIISYFIASQVPIKNIENKTPDLETVFLNLTGRKLRD